MTVTDYDIEFCLYSDDRPTGMTGGPEFRRYVITQSAMTRRWTIIMTGGVLNRAPSSAYRFKHAADAEAFMEHEFPGSQLMAVQAA